MIGLAERGPSDCSAELSQRPAAQRWPSDCSDELSQRPAARCSAAPVPVGG